MGILVLNSETAQIDDFQECILLTIILTQDLQFLTSKNILM